MNIEQLKENSLNEGVTSVDIAQTDEIISSIIEQKQLDSLAYQICDVQTIHGPTGAQFSIQYIEKPEILAQAQINTITAGTLVDGTTYSVYINSNVYSLTYDVVTHTDEAGYMSALAPIIDGDSDVSATVSGVVITATAIVAGTPFTISTSDVELSVIETQENIEYTTASKAVSILRNNVQVEDDAIQNTGFTLESIQDIQAQFGKNAIDFIGKTFSGISSGAENAKLITKMQEVAVGTDTVTLTSSDSAESNVFQITQKAAEEILTMNSINYRTMDSFVILPIKGAASFLALGSYFSDTDNESGLFIGKKGRIKYYVNPILGDDNVYVGLNGKLPGNSSLIFSPYQHTLITAQDPDTGNTNVFNVNRYAITENTLSTSGNEMIRKFILA